ncbi:Aspartic proteinase-like protein 1 [Hordeum vulgare]|nr:Aspartic proteinase-like protein 1 [Hordeum vulgare]
MRPILLPFYLGCITHGWMSRHRTLPLWPHWILGVLHWLATVKLWCSVIYGASIMQDRDLGIYKPAESTTSRHLPCSHELCPPGSGCSSPKQPCPYSTDYLQENTTSSGLLIEDILQLDSRESHAPVKASVVIGAKDQHISYARLAKDWLLKYDHFLHMPFLDTAYSSALEAAKQFLCGDYDMNSVGSWLEIMHQASHLVLFLLNLMIATSGTGGSGESVDCGSFSMACCSSKETQLRSLINLTGFCSEDNERILVYPYMLNGTVASQLQDTISVNLFLVSNLCCQSQLHHVANAFMPLNGLPNLAKSSERPEAVAMAVPELSLSSPAIDAPCMAAPSADSSAVTDAGAQSQQQSAQRKARRCWSPELHRRFVAALQHLGGPQGGCWAVR